MTANKNLSIKYIPDTPINKKPAYFLNEVIKV